MLELHKKLDISSKNYLSVLKILNSDQHKARLIGGVVRDSFLGIKSQDIDIATTMLPEEVSATFTSLGYKTTRTGIKFGTVSVIFNGEIFEVTTLRKDMICDGRHVKVEYTDDFKLDALRRDFTINALSYCPFEAKIYDYFDGINDLKAGIVKFIGDPSLRIKEDYLRILRFFRFFGRFGQVIQKTTFNKTNEFQGEAAQPMLIGEPRRDLQNSFVSLKVANSIIDANSLDACIKHKSFLKLLSRERVKTECDLILDLPNYPTLLALLGNSGILQEIFPVTEFYLDHFTRAEEQAQKWSVNLDKETKYALLFASRLDNINLSHTADTSRVGGSVSGSLAQRILIREHRQIPQPSIPNLEVSKIGLLGLKFSRIEAKKITNLLLSSRQKLIDDNFLKSLWLQHHDAVQFFLLLTALFAEEKEKIEIIFLRLKNLKKPTFPINGDDLTKTGLSGQSLGQILKQLKKIWIQSDFQLTKEELMSVGKNYLRKLSRRSVKSP